jgi:hypothetical protein
MLQYVVLLGALINATGSLRYIRDTLRGTTRPNRVTYLMWAIAPLIATAAAVSRGVTWAAVPIFMSGFCPLMVFLSSFANRDAYWKLGVLDYLCGAFSALALILWAITKEPTIAIVLAIASDGLAAIPTLLKAWSFPETETGISYVLAFLSASTSFAAVRHWTFTECGFAIYLVILSAMLSLSVYRRKWQPVAAVAE